jgi:hypothetical protein
LNILISCVLTQIRYLRPRTRSDEEGGLAYLELALILPVMITLLFAALELSRYLRVAESVSEMSRTVGEHVYRDCLGNPDHNSLDDCISKNIRPAVSGAQVPYLENFQIMITIWRNIYTAPSVLSPAKIYQGGFQTDSTSHLPVYMAPATTNTHYMDSTTTDPLLLAAVENNYKSLPVSGNPNNAASIGGVVIVEVTVPFQLLSGTTPFLSSLSKVYEQTIF